MSNTDKPASKFGAITNYVLKKVWAVFAITLVVFALLMSLLRYSLPFLNDHKDYVQNYIAKEYAIDVDIGELSASWLSNGPAVVLRKVNIDKGELSPLGLQVAEVFIEIDFWASFMSGKLQSQQVVLNTLDLEIDLTQFQSNQTDFPIVGALENIFLEQLSNFTVTDSRLTLISKLNTESIDIGKLSWLNKGNRHQGVGEFALEDFSDNNASFILDLYGDTESYSGTLFAQARDINLSAWINEYTGLDSQLSSSKGNVEVWAQINSGKVERIDGQLLPTSLLWKTSESEISNVIQAKFAAVNNQQQWDFSIVDVVIDTQQKALTTAINGYITQEQVAVLRMASPISLQTLGPLSGLFSQAIADKLAFNDVDANLNDFTAYIDKSGVMVLAQLENLQWLEHNEIVGISDIDANIYWKNKRGKIVLSSVDSELISNYYFGRSLPITALHVPILIDMASNTTVVIDNATADIDGVSIGISSEYASNSGFLSLELNTSPFALAKVPSLLPKHLISNDTHRFLANAFTGDGQIKNAHVLYHGATSEFPFDNNTGVFQSSLAIENADFIFSDGWPALSQLDIDLMFENRGLAMRSPASSLDKVKLTNLRAEIPNLTKNAMLTITADGAASSQDLTDLMLQSSLATSLGSLLANDIQVNGNLSTELGLYIPLSNGANTRAKGEVFFKGNQVLIPAIKLALNDTNGTVVFDNEQISIKNLSANLLNQAVKVDVFGEQGDTGYSLKTSLMGNWQILPLMQNASDELKQILSGSTTWNLDVALELQQSDFIYSAELNTDLVGFEANLPAPLFKNKSDVLPLRVLSNGDRIASSVTMTLGDIAVFEGALPHKEMQFNRAHLAVGEEDSRNLGVGFSINAVVDELDLNDWLPLMQAVNSSVDNTTTSILASPQRVFIDAKKVNVAGHFFNNVDLTIKRFDDQWALDVKGDEIQANASVFDDRFSKGVVINADFVKLEKNEAQTDTYKAESFEPKSLPRINFTCKSCDIYGIKLGSVDVIAQPNNDGLEFTRISIDNPQGLINATGQWYKRNQDHYTFIAGGLDSNNFGDFLKHLGFDSGIKDSSANLTFALTWQDSPIGMDLKHLDGKINWRLSDGYLTELSDKGSRIFTLLSLNSLVRKLSLDFRDVFAKGFFYDSMQGSIQITEGRADTRDTNIDGAAGEIEIYGHTDLVTQALNYNINFTPNVTGNLPVLVYFMVNPPTALAALALDKMLTSAKVISNVNYSVTGTIQEPILIETGRQSTEVDLPEKRDPTLSEELFPVLPLGKQELN